jgi:hypothetical protein
MLAAHRVSRHTGRDVIVEEETVHFGVSVKYLEISLNVGQNSSRVFETRSRVRTLLYRKL